MPVNNEVANEHNHMQPSCFCKRTKALVLTRGQTAFSALHIFTPYNSLQSTNLCVHIKDREAFRGKAHGQHTGCAASTCSVTHSQLRQCLLITANALHSSGWQKNNIPYQQVKPLRARPTMKTLSPLVNRLSRVLSPTGVIDQIVHTMSMYLYMCHIVCDCKDR